MLPTMRSEIIKLHKKLDTTFVYVTHDQTEAMTMGDRIVVMKDGVIQQTDTPENLYNMPCNLFVAGFIGSPQMNFFDSVILIKDDKAYIDFAGKSIPLPSCKVDAIQDYNGKEVTVGIRPEHFEIISEDCAADELAVDGIVDLAEMMGAEIYYTITCGDRQIMARRPFTDKIKEGSRVKIKINNNKIYAFDKENEKTII